MVDRKKGIVTMMFLLVALPGMRSNAQALPAGESRFDVGASASVGGMRTQVADYGFKALGYEVGVFAQGASLFGAEVRAGVYPIKARFVQAPVTAGVRLAPHWALPGHARLFGYVGGGYSRAQDAGPHYVATPAKWSPCWQVSQEIDFRLGRVRWKAYEATFTETYTPLRNLPSLSLSTGITLNFGH
jgi:hypothetical protein